MNNGRSLHFASLSALFVFAIAAFSIPAYPAETSIANPVQSASQDQCPTARFDYSCETGRWSGYYHVVFEVLSSFEGEQFALLETAMSDAERSAQIFPDGSTPADAAYEGLTSALGMRNRETTEQRFARWRQAVPDSAYVDFADALYAEKAAWQSRAAGTAGVVSDDSWGKFYSHMQIAEISLKNAPASAKTTSYWSRLAFVVASNSPRTELDRNQVFQDAISRRPRFFQLYRIYLIYLYPEWGGSWAEYERFISDASEVLAPTEGRSVYARLYLNLRANGHRPSETKLDWGRMKTSFDDLIARYPDPKLIDAYRSYACFYRDWRAYESAKANLPPDYEDSTMWINGTNARLCDKVADLSVLSQSK